MKITRVRALLLFLLPLASSAQITILTTPWPTGPDPTDAGFLWPGGLIALVCTGLKVPESVIRSHRVPLPHKLAGIRVKVGIGRYRCNSGLRDNPTGEGLDAPILEVADHGEYQQVTVQVPWEYIRYPRLPSGEVCQGGSQVSVSQNGVTATNSVDGKSLSSHFFLDRDGYVLAQHAADLSWVTAKNPGHPGETLILHAANLGSVVGPPATGYPTPRLFSTVISESGQTAGPFVLDTTHVYASLALFHDSVFPVPAAITVQSITLTPGTVSRYQITMRLPMFSFPPDATYSIEYLWSYCPDGPGNSFLCQGHQTASSTSKIYLVSP